MHGRTFAGVVSLAALAWSTAAAAQDVVPVEERAEVEGETITVTGTRMGQTDIQDTAIAITAVTAEQFSNSGSRDVRDILTFSPSVSLSQNGSGAGLYIRGVGSNNLFAGSDPSSTMYIDGVYIARPTSFFTDLYEVQQIEVLRGPQGTLYGRNAVGGTINVSSQDPTDYWSGSARLIIGNYNTFREYARISGPITPGAAFSLSGRKADRDGFFRNVTIPDVSGRPENEDDFSLRGQLLVEPGADVSVHIRSDYAKSHTIVGQARAIITPTGYDPVADSLRAQPRVLANDTPPAQTIEAWGVSAEVNFPINADLNVQSLTAYRAFEAYEAGDTDFSAAHIRKSESFQDQSQFSQELTLTGRYRGFKFVAGLFYFNESIDPLLRITTFGVSVLNISPAVKSEAIAGFFQGTLDITDKLSLTAGARYTSETKTFDQRFAVTLAATGNLAPGHPITYLLDATYNAWTPKIALEFRPTDAILAYASATRGFKSGGYSITSTSSLQGFDPEYLWSYEAGLKTEWLDRLLTANLTAFYYDYTNLQVQSFLTTGVVDITNAATAETFGLELEANVRPAPGLSFGGALTYLDAKYKAYPGALAPGNIAYDASGNRLNASPELSYNLRADYRSPVSASMELFGGVNWSWRSRQFYTPQNVPNESQSAYGLLDAHLGVSFGKNRFDVMVFGRNLTDRTFYTTTATIAGVTFGTLAAPRTYGIQLNARF